MNFGEDFGRRGRGATAEIGIDYLDETVMFDTEIWPP